MCRESQTSRQCKNAKRGTLRQCKNAERGTLTLIVMLTIAACPLWVQAAERVVTLDPEATTISFTLGATMHTVHGSLRLAEGSVRFDDRTGEASGRVVVDARSGETGNESRDRKMHRQVLLSESFPEIVLTLDRVVEPVVESDTSQLELYGSIRLLDAEHEVKLPVEVEVVEDRIVARLEFEVPYVEWGLKNPSKFMLRVDKLVTVSVQAHGMLNSSPGPASKAAGTTP